MLDLKEAYRRLDPAKPLERESLTSYYVARPTDPIVLLAEELHIRESSLHVLLIGQRGIGKSTELARLTQALFSKRRCYLIDLGFSTLPFSVGEAIADVVRQIVSCHDSEFSAGWFGSTKSTILANLAAAEAPEGEKISKNLDVVHELLRQLKQLPTAVSGNEPVLLLDGPERLPSESLVELLRTVRRIECSVVMVAPPRIALGGTYSTAINEWDRTTHLPAISVRAPSQEVEECGVRILKAVVEKRAEVGTFEPEALDLLIGASAGVHRELLSLAQQALIPARLAGRSTVAVADARAVVEEKRNEVSYSLTPADWKLLRRYAAATAIALEPKLIPLIDRNLIISYRADWTWFGIHPLLRPRLNLIPKAEAS